MHDWTLISISFNWKGGDATLHFLNSESNSATLLAHGVSMLIVPRKLEWGRSVSVNSVKGPFDLADGKMKIEVEMQSGDVIEIVAETIMLP